MASPSKAAAFGKKPQGGRHETVRRQKAIVAQIRAAGFCARALLQGTNVDARGRGR